VKRQVGATDCEEIVVSAESEAINLAEVHIDGVDARVRVFRAGHEVDTCVVTTERYVVVVDTMGTPELAADIMERVGDALAGRQLLVVNTHADWDHSWGNALFAIPGGRYPAPIIGHDQTRRRLLDAEERAYLRERQRGSSRFANVALVPPTLTFTDGLRIDGGDLTLELLPTPGHTPDHISIWIPESRLVLAGDAAERPIPYVNEPGDLPLLRASLARLAALEPVAVVPCHGGTSAPSLLTRNLTYFDTLEARARSTVDEGRLPEDWAGREDLPDIIGLPFAEAAPDLADAPADVVAFYRASHQCAARAMLTYLQGV